MLNALLAISIGGLADNVLDRAVTDIYQNDQLQLSLIAEREALQPEGGNWIGLHFEMADGWHIYWQNPGDNGAPPEVSLTLPAGVSSGDINWPVPEKFYLDTFVDYGYHEALLMFPLNIDAKSASVLVEAQVNWLACKDICLPGDARLQLQLPVAGRADYSFQAPLFTLTRKQLPEQRTGLNASLIRRGDEVIVQVDSALLNEGSVIYPLTKHVVRYDQVPRFIHNESRSDIHFKADAYLGELPDYLDIVITRPDCQPVQIRARAVRGN